MMMISKINGLVWMIVMVLDGVMNLKDVKVNIPLAVSNRDTVTLQCDFDLEGEPLYVVRWYKGSRLFYRYIPKELPPIQVFPVNGIDVDTNKSDRHKIVLRDVRPITSGKYKCAVDTDSPHFYSSVTFGYMYVIDIPDEEPLLQVKIKKTPESSFLNANCSAPAVFPPANVTWLINGKIANETHQIAVEQQSNQSSETAAKKIFSTVSYLERELNEKSFKNGKLELACVVTIFNLYETEKTFIIEDDRPKPRSSLVLATFIHSSGVVLAKCHQLLGILQLILYLR